MGSLKTNQVNACSTDEKRQAIVPNRLKDALPACDGLGAVHAQCPTGSVAGLSVSGPFPKQVFLRDPGSSSTVGRPISMINEYHNEYGCQHVYCMCPCSTLWLRQHKRQLTAYTNPLSCLTESSEDAAKSPIMCQLYSYIQSNQGRPCRNRHSGNREAADYAAG